METKATLIERIENAAPFALGAIVGFCVLVFGENETRAMSESAFRVSAKLREAFDEAKGELH